MHRDMTEGERIACIRFQAEQLLADARALNVNVRITGVPKLPLAARSYTAAIDVYAVQPDRVNWVELNTLECGDKFRFVHDARGRVFVVFAGPKREDEGRWISCGRDDVKEDRIFPLVHLGATHVYKIEERKV